MRITEVGVTTLLRNRNLSRFDEPNPGYAGHHLGAKVHHLGLMRISFSREVLSKGIFSLEFRLRLHKQKSVSLASGWIGVCPNTV
jgi:hypothetical protein